MYAIFPGGTKRRRMFYGMYSGGSRLDKDGLSYLNPEDHEQIFNFFIDTTNRIMKAFTPFAKKYKHKSLVSL